MRSYSRTQEGVYVWQSHEKLGIVTSIRRLSWRGTRLAQNQRQGCVPNLTRTCSSLRLPPRNREPVRSVRLDEENWWSSRSFRAYPQIKSLPASGPGGVAHTAMGKAQAGPLFLSASNHSSAALSESTGSISQTVVDDIQLLSMEGNRPPVGHGWPRLATSHHRLKTVLPQRSL
jgi:hypothetical protein